MTLPLPFNPTNLKTPCHVVDEARLLHNLKLLRLVQERAGCKILLAQKAFSMFALYPLIGKYLSGTAASGLYEARLGAEEMAWGSQGMEAREPLETHVFSAAYSEEEFRELLGYCDHIVFNSFAQWEKLGPMALRAGKQCGIRVNPECSTQGRAIYDPCAPRSRLGVTAAHFQKNTRLLDGITGLHFHTLCEQGSDALEITLQAFCEKFGKYLPQMRWVNFGGGHHITREGYDIERLVRLITEFKQRYDVEVYLEPGEAVALDAGFLVSSVLDIVENDGGIAILDTSAACHMPDVLEMPYRPEAIGGGLPGAKPFEYRLAGPTCLAGDVIGDYSFDEPLSIGSKVVFADMAIYSMVKSNTFNGMPLPSIMICRQDGAMELVKTFGYADFRGRLS